MIKYEYQCTKCDEVFETPSRNDVTHCGSAAKRKFSLGGIAFRGNGFYKTDK
jgi:predicted nucleic acid-binding Zn ribbon protein